MDALLSWITTTPVGRDAARLVLMLLGVGMWINLLLLAAYVKRQAVPVHTMALVVCGAATGVGAAHSGAVGNLAAGAMFIAGAAACLIGLLLSVVGTPRSMSRHYCTPLDRTRWWIQHIAEPVRDLKDITSDWMGLETPSERKKERQR